MKLNFFQNDDAVERLVELISTAANTSKIGDGKVFVLDVESALRIRTGEKDAAAVEG